MTAVLSLACLLLLAVPPLAVAAEPLTFALDPAHTRVLFAIDHAGFSKALGTVSGSTGRVRFAPLDDGVDWTGAELDVRIPIERLDLGDPDWNRATLGRSFLDAARYPEARFVSTTVEPHDARTARVCGELTLHGVTRPLCLDVVFNAYKRHPLPPFRRTAGFSATATLDRRDFGIDAWSSVIGHGVELRIEAEAVRDRAADREGDTP
ncbi:MAG TPA: YceI family protein [Lysobacter sp.]|nr:YceI family protein [Lysobacter sp.]